MILDYIMNTESEHEWGENSYKIHSEKDVAMKDNTEKRNRKMTTPQDASG